MTKVYVFILERIQCLIVVYARHYKSVEIEVVTGDLGIKQLPPFFGQVESIFLHNGKLMVIGRSRFKMDETIECHQLDNGTWKFHSSLNKPRIGHSAIATPTATFVFGGDLKGKTYEYLPKDSNTWLMGKTKIPRANFIIDCAIAAKSGQEVWLIQSFKKILSFNINDHTFHELPCQLSDIDTKCAFIPNSNKIMITGSGSFSQIFDPEEKSVTLASPLNTKRYGYGMGIITINGEDKLAVVCGIDKYEYDDLDSVELYNAEKKRMGNNRHQAERTKTQFCFPNNQTI